LDRPKSGPNPSPFDRRAFFRQVLLRGVEKAEGSARAIGKRLAPLAGEERGTKNEERRTTESPSVAPAPRFLRPPGALPEDRFAETCSRCGECVRACPAECIKLDTTSENRAGGLPHIIARQSPCVICDDLSCMKVCPTGALKLVESVDQIHMGVAVVDHDRCLRGPSGQKEDCRLCITPCPIGEKAIGLDAQGLIEIRAGCTGCGVCERACPTEPASVWVVPG
jgi:ferredoxin-type protein NapG